MTADIFSPVIIDKHRFSPQVGMPEADMLPSILWIHVNKINTKAKQPKDI